MFPPYLLLTETKTAGEARFQRKIKCKWELQGTPHLEAKSRQQQVLLKAQFFGLFSAHDPDRNGDRLLPRQTNFLPPRPPQMTSLTADPKLREKAELKMKTWLHIVARTKTIPKEFVCGEECEQHSIYGRLFDGHPLNHVKSESPLHSTIAD